MTIVLKEWDLFILHWQWFLVLSFLLSQLLSPKEVKEMLKKDVGQSYLMKHFIKLKQITIM